MKILLEKGKNVMQILRRFLKNWMNSFREWRNEVSAVPHRLFFETDVNDRKKNPVSYPLTLARK